MSGYDSDGASKIDAEWIAREKHIAKIAYNYGMYNRVEDIDHLENALKLYYGKGSKEHKKFRKAFCNGG